jgi:acetylornithine aminotransferase
VLDVIEEEHLIDNAATQGAYLMEQLRTMNIPGLKELRGRGLMIGIEFEGSAKEIRQRLLFEQHVFTGAAGTSTIRLLPPLCLSREDCDLFIERFKKVL